VPLPLRRLGRLGLWLWLLLWLLLWPVLALLGPPGRDGNGGFHSIFIYIYRGGSIRGVSHAGVCVSNRSVQSKCVSNTK